MSTNPTKAATRFPLRTAASALLAGLGTAFLCFFVALMVSGAGHGWNTPIWFSFAGFVVFPIGAWVIGPAKQPVRLSICAPLVVLALASNVFLFELSRQEGWQYFHRVAPFNYLWLGIWSLWQFAIFYAFGNSVAQKLK